MEPTKAKVTNPLIALQEYGQSIWLDYIRRNLITSGELEKLIVEDGLRGVTSNPSIFEKAITASTDYTTTLEELASQNLDPKSIYERLAIRDIQDAADVLRSVYEQTKRRDGYVSLEVSPQLAHNTQGTIEEARRLWQTVGRDNLMVKVPATAEGIPAIRQLIAEGINVNVTLLFSQQAYEQVAEAYIAGLEQLAANGGDVSRMASVASFFVSRIDTAIDGLLTDRLKVSTNASEQSLLRSIMGRVAIANAKLTYQRYQEIFSGERWQKLANKGAQTQRVLWASTSTKNPQYRDVIYVEELIGRDTVNTIPPATLDAFRDHGIPRASLQEAIKAAQDTMLALEQAGISMRDITDRLLDDGVKLFAEAFDKLLKAVDRGCKGQTTARINRQTYKLPEHLAMAVNQSLEDWQGNDKLRRLWARDASLWTGTDESNWLGWLAITQGEMMHRQRLIDIAAEIKESGFSHALLLGMGGSSLCPEVMKMTFGKIEGYPELYVLDSTDPAQIKSVEDQIDLAHTIFIVSSKSGSTLEPNIFKEYFFERVKQVIGEDKVGGRFIAITDPGSKLQQVAEADGFRHIFYGAPSIGGRYSALSNFGLVPAAIMGVDVNDFLNRAEEMVQACASCVPAKENPGVVLGNILGVLAKNGHDKVTVITSPNILDLGAWLEQLLAESTGKEGKGLIPVDREDLGGPEVYGDDRVFVYLRLETAPDSKQDVAVAALEQSGQPVVRIFIDDIRDLGEEFFRWEIATAVAGSIIGINAFNQPDVEASKIATRNLTQEYEQTGELRPEVPLLQEDDFKLFTDEKNALVLQETMAGDPSLVCYLNAHLSRLGNGDYFAVLGYIAMNHEHEAKLQKLRHAVRDRKRVATCLGFGPRFLHSTGQAYKGGPNSGVFLQITCDDANDLTVPDQKYSFGVVKTAQARGDFQVLTERDRRALRVHLGSDVDSGLARLAAAIRLALA
jgi:transaldolase / glucose-6-phosphate isomerase